MAELKSLRHFVVVSDGLVQRAIADEVEDGGEGFVVDDLEVVRGGDEAGADVTAAGILGAPERFAAVKDLAALRADGGEGVLHVLHRAGVDERAHQRAGLSGLPMGTCRYASARRRVSLARTDSWTMMRRVVVQRWPAVPTAPKRMRAHGEVQVGAGGDDDGVVAAQFEEGAAQAAADDFADVPAHLGRAGGGDRAGCAGR